MSDPFYNFLQTGGQQAPVQAQPPPQSSGNSFQQYLESGGEPPTPAQPSLLDRTVSGALSLFGQDFPVTSAVIETGLHEGSKAAGGVAGGLVGLGSLPFGVDRAVANENAVRRALTYEPRTGAGQAVSGLLDAVGASNLNPGNWPDALGKWGADWASAHGASPGVSTAIRMVPDAAMAVLGGGFGAKEIPKAEAPPEIGGVKDGDVPMPLSTESPARTPYSTVGEAPAGAPDPFVEEAQTAEPGGTVPTAEQLRRQRILNEVGLGNVPIRKSAVSGDPLEAATDFQLSKLNTEPGQFATQLLSNEREGLRNYSAETVGKTGGRIGDTQTDSIARGESVVGALESLSDNYNKRIGGLYQEADARAKGVPTDLKGFQDTLKDDSLMTNQDRVGLRGGLNAYLKKLGVVDDNGNITASVQQAETIRKYLNDEWSPQNSKFVAKLKNSLDDDVTQAAGDDIYKQARALRAEKGQLLDDPKGISDLMDSSGPNGINRKVGSDKVMQRLETMPPEQLDHVLGTLRKTAGSDDPGLSAKAQAALGDIKSHFATRLAQIGDSQEVQWNSKGYNQYLKNNNARINSVFADDPETLKRLYTTNEAGKILRFNPSYPGAAAQAVNLSKAGTIPRYLQAGAATLGATAGSVLGPFGAALGETVGAAVGGKAARALADRAAMRAAKARSLEP